MIQSTNATSKIGNKKIVEAKIRICGSAGKL